MVDIISKRDGPRREDIEARRLIDENRGTIRALANRLTGGQFAAPKPAKAEPEAKGLIVHALGAARTIRDPKPYIRISPNSRVVVADADSGRQMQFLGEIRRMDGVRRFVLATKANGFFAPVEPEIGEALAGLDGVRLGGDYPEERLAAEIGERLGVT
ncbi:MAG TPA: hypothetical protein VFR34_13535 [Paracoccaceae bacterium]|nr:hypothetical protein [Paracoccaceae bacterium]